MPENKNEVQKVVKYWQEKGVGVGVRVLNNWGGNLESVVHNIEQDRIACGCALGQLGITWDGRAVICGQDYEATNVIGDVNTESIQTIWNRKENFIKNHINHQFAELPALCRQCTNWALVASEEHFYENGEKYERSYEFDGSMINR